MSEGTPSTANGNGVPASAISTTCTNGHGPTPADVDSSCVPRQGLIASAASHVDGLTLVGGAYDGLSASLVERAGFDAVWASGFCISASRLLPDCSVMTVEDLVTQVATMTRATTLPVLVDCDEGYGDIHNTYELARQLAACGAAGICIEDSAYPKVNSFYEESHRDLADADYFVDKLRAIRKAAPKLTLIARTESLIARQSLEVALARGMRYAESGVDYVIIHSRFTDIGEFNRLTEAWRSEVPLGVIPTVSHVATWRDLHALGFKLVIYANQALRAGVHAQESALRDIRDAKAASAYGHRMASLDHIFGLTGLRENARISRAAVSDA